MTQVERERSAVRQVGSTAVVKVAVMGVAGLAGIVTSRLVIEHYGVDAFAQYGLLTGLTGLMPFADLGVAAVIVNAVASAAHPRTDREVRRTITSAFRILLVSATVIATVAVLAGVLGWWPTLLGQGLMGDRGAVAATVCLLVFAVALPLGVGQRVLVALGRTAQQTALGGIASPLVLGGVAASVALAWSFGPYVAVFSYVANATVALVSLVLAARLLSPQVTAAARDVPRLRAVPGARVVDVAWPMLVQMIALPMAMQTDRLLLSHLAGTAELAEYNLGSQTFGLINQVVAAAGVALWPVYARARAAGKVESPARPAAVFTALATALGLLLWLVLPVVTQLITQGKIELSTPLAASFVLFVVVQAAKYPLGMYMTDAAGLRFQVAPIVAMVPLNLGLSWVLIAPLGAAGPVLGSAVSVLVCQVVPNAWYVRRDLARRRVLAPVAG
ncbi:lipopolysaccharide biosynthesis protein [Cellulomonas shaoxiangyii]|uniref:Polysaccharide biosynthesis protein n=1 Tax=Cellulomonas shaoxiangyii TaxID=2566013 RepID=A0A4V1CMX2_9CELL|nr:oligosaccharide flippase family protein [Cellulomonas shaoxiangyii]QCB94435.1 polysaccharide biosynthesis protein [Cellulomonas shaoxiangyii]TGY85160.1 polysaccharide biosynthesis protein [Cellulomonas shaoxiangyii]